MSRKPLISPELSLEALRQQSTGKGVQVAVIDSGIDPHHPDLSGKVVRSCVVSKEDGAVVCREIDPLESTDDFGHGTAVGGIITALAPAAELVTVRVLNEYNACSGEILIAGIRWALEQNIKLINMSLATLKEKFFPELFYLCEQAYQQDAILVVSRRNLGDMGCPAMFSSVISVERGEIAEPYGLHYKTGNLIECDAFGTRVRTLAPGGGYVEQTGTSFAAPHVTGFIALMVELWPDLLAVEAKTLLKAFSRQATGR
ncbi:MAG: serine protease [Desulfuromonas sp.]|nr:MAG: serine protease [Desulfuromonas sp.]